MADNNKVVVELGQVAKERGIYTAGSKYYKDNIVEYMGAAYIAEPATPNGYVTVAPWTTDRSTLNTGWRVFADGNPGYVEEIADECVRLVNEAIDAYQPIVVEGDVNNAPDEEDLTSVNVGGTDVIKFKDKAYAPAAYSGMGRVYLRKNILNGVNTLTQDMFYKGEVGSRVPNTNTIFVIQYDFTFGEDITVPENCVLEFNGGSISGAHTLKGNGTFINSDGLCIKKNVTIGGTWSNTTIYTRWFEFISSEDGVTDNSLCFKQLQAVINGTNGCKVEFEEGYYQTSILDTEPEGYVEKNGVTYPKWAMNTYMTDSRIVLCILEIPYIDINLNGSTIKAINITCPGWRMIYIGGVENGYVHDGTLIGMARQDFDYPLYANWEWDVQGYAHYQTPVQNYEFGILLYSDGGFCTFSNMNVKNSAGTGIAVGGGGWYYPEGSTKPDGTSISTGVKLFYAKGYIVRDCEVSYCGSVGIWLKSSKEGQLINCHIHNIGSGINNSSGKDEQGVLAGPLCTGIDIEFHDGRHDVPVMRWDSLYIHDCGKNVFSFATPQLSKMKQFTAINLHCIGFPLMNNMNADGSMEFINCYFKQDGTTSIEGTLQAFYGPIFSNCTFDNLCISTNIGFGSVYNDCRFICGEKLDTGANKFVFNQTDSKNVFNRCVFKLNYNTHLESAILYNCELELDGSYTLYCGGAELYRCHIICDSTLTYTWRFHWLNAGTKKLVLDGCLVENMSGIGDAVDSYTFSYPAYEYNISNCIFKGITSVVHRGDSIFNLNNSKFEAFTIRGYLQNAASQINIDNCVVKNVYAYGSFYTVDGAIIPNVRGFNSRIEATSSFNVNNTKIFELYNCVLGGSFSESTFAGVKKGCVFE